MSLVSKLYFRTAIDIVHDLAAGMFPGLALAAWMIRSATDAEGAAPTAILRASPTLWLLVLLTLLVVVLTGVVRLRYWKLNVRSGFLEAKARMAGAKHAVFVSVMLGSVALLVMALSWVTTNPG